ncbi:hypothetical protein [Herbaspirillum sp. RV1423]|uniref:hypothetical protein n=1 Tax=Herbaspirillum sp. RV1423 TaxID=1443993 RepID=UPI0018CBFB12|nr:hypothetical protein [Herbaspirillum sp. RV1423]
MTPGLSSLTSFMASQCICDSNQGLALFGEELCIYREEKARLFGRSFFDYIWDKVALKICQYNQAMNATQLSEQEKNAKQISAATLRNRIRYLTSACRYALKRHGMCEHDPAEPVIAPMARNQRRRYIERREMLQLHRACRHMNAYRSTSRTMTRSAASFTTVSACSKWRWKP